jgi:hypothetical protein
MATITQQEALRAANNAIYDILCDDYNFRSKQLLEAMDAYMKILELPDGTEIESESSNTAIHAGIGNVGERSKARASGNGS